jgi:putative endonuclease
MKLLTESWMQHFKSTGNLVLEEKDGTTYGRCMVNWQLYIILCSDDSLYTGITTDVERRFREHAEGRGARYFRGRRPVRVVYLERGLNRSSAGKRELQVKLLSRAEKFLLLGSAANLVAAAPVVNDAAN